MKDNIVLFAAVVAFIVCVAAVLSITPIFVYVFGPFVGLGAAATIAVVCWVVIWILGRRR